MLLWVVKSIINTQNRVPKNGMRAKEKNAWELKVFCNSDGAGNKDNRYSITSNCVYFKGCLIAWNKNIIMSWSEAEYVVTLEVCAEIMFVKMILSFMVVEVSRPIKVNCDNVGAIFSES